MQRGLPVAARSSGKRPLTETAATRTSTTMLVRRRVSTLDGLRK
jgi:hypothetical protein